jgi:hypothetical protein
VKRPKKVPIRENRIHNQAIVDAYGLEEQAMSWYYYLDNWHYGVAQGYLF